MVNEWGWSGKKVENKWINVKGSAIKMFGMWRKMLKSVGKVMGKWDTMENGGEGGRRVKRGALRRWRY